jgi:SAM-dependent methyltransferase
MADGMKARQLAAESLNSGDPVSWFERLYAEANGKPEIIPWTDMRANSNLTSWLGQNAAGLRRGRALVIGCGLGDDAEALSQVGFDVIAFDVSPTAIRWCQRRFPASKVQYCVEDLFHPPFHWASSFDFVLESYTLQVLPASVRGEAQRKIASLVAPQGCLLIICRGRDDGDDEGNMPWPLTMDELRALLAFGLEQRRFEDYLDGETPPVRRFRAEYHRS